MSYHYHTIVDQYATAASADTLGSRVLDLLIREQIVESQKSDCLFKTDGGYAPGLRFREAIRSLNERHLDSFLSGKMKGLDIVTGRTVFHAGDSEVELECEHCSNRGVAPVDWGDVVGQWYDGDDGVTLRCPSCSQTQLITKWKHIPTYGFGHLGFQFLNWPDLKESFVKQVGECLGHPVVLVTGHG